MLPVRVAQLSKSYDLRAVAVGNCLQICKECVRPGWGRLTPQKRNCLLAGFKGKWIWQRMNRSPGSFLPVLAECRRNPRPKGRRGLRCFVVLHFRHTIHGGPAIFFSGRFSLDALDPEELWWRVWDFAVQIWHWPEDRKLPKRVFAVASETP